MDDPPFNNQQPSFFGYRFYKQTGSLRTSRMMLLKKNYFDPFIPDIWMIVGYNVTRESN